MADLRCAQYSVWFRDELGRPVSGCDLSDQEVEGFWSRGLRRKSQAGIDWSVGFGGSCCDCLPSPETTEMVVERIPSEGGPSSLVWKGPTVESFADSTFGEVQITACDDAYWWDERPIFHSDREKSGAVDEADLWLEVRRDQESWGSTGLLLQDGHKTGRSVDLDWVRDQSVSSVTNELQVDWTIVAGRLVGPGPVDGGLPFGQTLDVVEHWDPSGAGVSLDASRRVSVIVVVSSDGRFRGEWPPNPSGKTKVEVVVSPTVGSDAEAEEKARGLVESQTNTPNIYVVSQTASLNESAPLCIEDLIPGRRFLVDAGPCGPDRLFPMVLTGVLVRFGFEVRSSAGLWEQSVSIDLAPVGSSLDLIRGTFI